MADRHRGQRVVVHGLPGGVFHTPQNLDLYGQAARQVFFLAVSVYGWYRWYQFRKSGAGGSEGVGVAPAWAGWKGRV